jgi:hypothetical protein
MTKKHMKKMLTIPGHKGNANQSHTRIPLLSFWNSCHQEHHQQQMLVRIQGEKKRLYIAGGNVS